MDEILRIKNLSKRYDDISVLENIDLSVKKGEVVVIVGPSGCGKSTLLRCLNGLEEIQEGEVLLDDEVVNPNKKNLSKNREKIGMVFQSYDLFPHLTILQNVTLAPIKVKKRSKLPFHYKRRKVRNTKVRQYFTIHHKKIPDGCC